MIAPQTFTLLDRLVNVQTAAFKNYQFCSLNPHLVNISSGDADAAEERLERIKRIVEAAKTRQAKRDGWEYPPKMH